MGEYSNAGFPLSYCLLSTTGSDDLGKRKQALEAWAQKLRDVYGVIPVFVHVDKDMAEIGMIRDVWNAKIQLCWWHLRRAVRTRLEKSKLSTTPYYPQRAHAEFPFIDISFTPYGRADASEHEGGYLASLERATTSLPAQHANSVGTIKIPATQPRRTPLSDLTNSQRLAAQSSTCGTPMGEDENDEDSPSRRTFCQVEFRQSIIDLMENHFCAHPLIPGYARPTAAGIREWAVRQMFTFCAVNDLREVWAYLWENWYRCGRWELWARAEHPEIPRLKTTMMVESQCVPIFSVTHIALIQLIAEAGAASSMISYIIFTSLVSIYSRGF
jgi:hypothetical protein